MVSISGPAGSFAMDRGEIGDASSRDRTSTNVFYTEENVRGFGPGIRFYTAADDVYSAYDSHDDIDVRLYSEGDDWHVRVNLSEPHEEQAAVKERLEEHGLDFDWESPHKLYEGSKQSFEGYRIDEPVTSKVMDKIGSMGTIAVGNAAGVGAAATAALAGAPPLWAAAGWIGGVSAVGIAAGMDGLAPKAREKLLDRAYGDVSVLTSERLVDEEEENFYRLDEKGLWRYLMEEHFEDYHDEGLMLAARADSFDEAVEIAMWTLGEGRAINIDVRPTYLDVFEEGDDLRPFTEPSIYQRREIFEPFFDHAREDERKHHIENILERVGEEPVGDGVKAVIEGSEEFDEMLDEEIVSGF